MIKGLLILVMACLSTVIHADWPTYHGAPDLRGVSSAMLPDVPELLWRYNAGSDVDSTPVSDGDRIFFSSKKGMVVALDLKGSEVWKKTFTRMNDAGQEMPLRFEAPLACGGGLVFAGSTRGTLFALDAGTGQEKWRYETEGIIAGSPNLLGTNVVLIDQSEGALHCVDAQTGKLVWKTEGVERCDGSAGIGNGKIVFGSCLAALHVFDVDGQHVKDIEVGGDGQIAGGVAVDGPLAFAGVRDGSLLCADLEKGDIVWSSDESVEQTFSTPAVLDKLVVYASDNGYVYAVDRADGKLAWKFDTVGMPYSPAVAGDKVVASADGKLFLLKLDDGTKIWSKEISDEITGPAIINGMIVIGADDGTVSAFGSP
jgi:outer membrane protein assembly factor BamB